MALDDVWMRIGSEVGFYYRGNFEDVPCDPGVYAWFYPLRLLSRQEHAIDELVNQMQTLLSYDANSGEREEVLLEAKLSWWKWSATARRRAKEFQISDSLRNVWKETRADGERFKVFQEAVLKSSIFMPPLYVGKADDLSVRCDQHRRSSGTKFDFHKRFVEFAKKNKFPIDSVDNLIFACIKTESVRDEVSQSHSLIEELLKHICTPPYGVR
jgi:hypothetical protein